MADAGKIRVGVEIDSGDAFAEFTNAVMREIQPALNKVQQQMQHALQPPTDQVKSQYGSIGQIAAGSFIGSLGSMLAGKAMSMFTDFARTGMNAVKSVLESGFDRLVSIDTAKTKLEALGRSTAEVDQIMKSALESVKGTAFGLQDAATVAATAVAAGVGPGEALTKYLKLIADTAAVAKRNGESMGSAFNDVGAILNKVTTMGYGTNEILQQLSERGLPIYVNLAKRLNMTTGEVVNLAEKTGIAASDIRAALEDTVGGAALKMGESFEGGMENVKAALARLGEAVLKPFFGTAKEGVFDLQKAIDGWTESIQKNMPAIMDGFNAVGQAIIGVAEVMAVLGAATAKLIEMFLDVQRAILDTFLAPIKLAAEAMDLIPDSVARAIPGFNGLHNALDAVNPLFEAASAKLGSLADSNHQAADSLGNLATNVLPKAGETLQSYVDRMKIAAEGNYAYGQSMKAMAASVAASTDPILYAGRVMLWQSQVQKYAMSGGTTPAPGPAPVFGPSIPGWLPPMQSSQMPGDTFKPPTGGGSGKKPDAGPLYPGGALPPVNVNGVQVQVTAPAMPMGAVPGMSAAFPGFAQNIPGVSTQGLQPQSMAALQAIFGQFGGTGIQFSSGYRATDPYEWHPGGRGLDIGIPNWNTPQGKAIGDQVNNWIQANKELLGVYGTLWQVADHYNHVHVSMKKGMSPLLGMLQSGQVPGLSGVPAGGLPGMPDLTGSMPGGVWQAPDPTQLREKQEKINDLQQQIVIQEQHMREMKADVAQSEKMAQEAKRDKLYRELEDAKSDLKDLEQGKYSKGKGQTGGAFSFDQLPFGHPLKIAAGAIMGAGGSQADAMALLGLGGPGMAAPTMQMPGTTLTGLQMPGMPAMPVGQQPMPVMQTPDGAFVPVQPIQPGQMPFAAPVSQAVTAAGQPAAAAAGDIAAAFWTTPLPGPMGYPGVPTAPSTDINQLVRERNPLAWAQMAGFNVPDYSRMGGGPGAQDLMQGSGLPVDAMGRMYSDTAALIDRTFTNLDAAEKARHDQVMTVLNEVRDRLGTDVVKPTTTAAVTAGIDGISSATTSAIGNQMGQAAAGPIASAVSSASAGSGGSGAQLVTTGVNAVSSIGSAAIGMATGGAVIGPGSGTSDSILARVSNGEWVLTGGQVRAMGGFRGVQSFVDRLPRFATGGGVDVSATVGAEFFGVGQIPIIATIVNLLVAVLLKVIGVTIEARDTLNEISGDFREFRGDFKAFDAYGRLMNDTSGLVDRTGSSEQAAADERIRILKLVLEGLFKFIVEKIIVPIAKAIGNSLLQAASGAAQGALGAAFPGGSIVGGAVGNVITSAGGAGIEIAGEVGTILAESIFSVGLQGAGELLQSVVPGLTNAVFGGNLLAFIADPIAMLLSAPFNVIGGLLGGLSTLIPGLSFDEGGVARGTGMMPKATISPERVLSPRQTQSFERLVDALSSGRGAATTTIHAPFTVLGGERGGREVRDRLLSLMN